MHKSAAIILRVIWPAAERIREAAFVSAYETVLSRSFGWDISS